jgi:hypothetical protein
MTTPGIKWGPCCFCGATCEEGEHDPCRVTVETSEGKWQVWFCHARCFKALLKTDFGLEPAHF